MLSSLGPADVFQFVFVTLQWRVFRTEQSPSNQQDHGGGSNDEIVSEVEANTKVPVDDFTLTTGFARSLIILENP